MKGALAALFALCAGCRDPAPPPPAASRLSSASCETLLPSAEAARLLGHPVSYRETRHRTDRYEALSCENRTRRAAEVFAFDVGCGVGARERYVSAVRAVVKAIRQTEPKVGAEAWASENVYLSWYPKRSCHTTVLISWRLPNADRLRSLAARLARRLP